MDQMSATMQPHAEGRGHLTRCLSLLDHNTVSNTSPRGAMLCQRI